jgi:hypothetical protein
MLTFYMDESGFTGESLISPEQPIFVQSSTTLSDAECRALYREFFSGVQAPELKHSIIARRPAGRERIIKFIKALQKHHESQVTTWSAHKEFTLLTYLVDLWVETAMHQDGIDLYEDGGNLALSNMVFYGLRTFQSPKYLTDHLTRFQHMMMKRTPATYKAFWGTMYADMDRVDERTRDILVFFLGSQMKLGFPHLVRLPKRAIDPAMAGAALTCTHWRKTTDQPLVLLHDQASNLAKDIEFWELITSPDIERISFGSGDRTIIYPLNVAKTEFGDSKRILQLQFCDIIAGASATRLRKLMGISHDTDYVQSLVKAEIDNLLIGCIWPSPTVSPDEMGTRGWNGSYLKTLTGQLEKLSRAKGK